MNRAVFLDRDGVINEIVHFPELGLLDSPLNPKQFKLLPDAAKAVKIFKLLGFKVIVVSNQPAIAKGKMLMKNFERIRLKMRRELRKEGASLDAEYYCFHHPSARMAEYKSDCDCRKPKPGLLLKAAENFKLDLSKCYAVGDNLTDVKAGKAVGCRTILIGSLKCDQCKLMEHEGVRPDHIAKDLLSASRIIDKEIKECIRLDLAASKMIHTPKSLKKR